MDHPEPEPPNHHQAAYDSDQGSKFLGQFLVPSAGLFVRLLAVSRRSCSQYVRRTFAERELPNKMSILDGSGALSPASHTNPTPGEGPCCYSASPTSPTSTVSLTELTLLFCKLSNAFNMVLTAVSLVPEPGKGAVGPKRHIALCLCHLPVLSLLNKGTE